MSKQLWVERYRPKTVADYVFMDGSYKSKVQDWIKHGIPHLLFHGPAGTGKAQPLHSKIKIPGGWTTMGEIQIGDEVSTPAGNISKVIGIYPQGEKEIYEITFADGRTVECCGDHLFKTYTGTGSQSPTSVRSVNEIIEYKNTRKGPIRIPVIIANHEPDAELPLDPYLLGAMLGDGGLRKGSFGFSTADSEMIDELEGRLPTGCTITKKLSSVYDYRFTMTEEFRSVNKAQCKLNEYINPLRKIIHELDLMDTSSSTKFIPAPYKEASLSQKLDLLAGLIDTDGYVDKRSKSVSYTTVSKQLAIDVRDLVRSIGGFSSIRTKTNCTYVYLGERRKCKDAYTVSIQYRTPRMLSKLPRKLAHLPENNQYADKKLTITNIALSNKCEAKCIMIDDPEHLYITDNYVVTHNTTLAKMLLNELGVDRSDILEINGSVRNGVDDIRETIISFADMMPFGEFRYVLLDEADYLSHNAQAALRGVMETYTNTTRFILTCNVPRKIIKPLKSRCDGFEVAKLDRTEYTARIATILITEGVQFELPILDQYVDSAYPDMRKCIGLVQQNGQGGILAPFNATDVSGSDYEVLINLIVDGKYKEARAWMINEIVDYEEAYIFMYEHLELWGDTEEKQNEAVLIIRKGLVDHTLIATPEICLAATMIQLSMI